MHLTIQVCLAGVISTIPCFAAIGCCCQALAAEKAAAAHEREMEVARLRALQEQVQDTRSAEDELRAKRYQVRQAQTGSPDV